ncbi:transcription factor HES-4-like [Anopheles merus]|uniref:BHLH domain-containing protein n=1 Tax=Anopheles merus TaxID=30066 RepID=A0A182VGV3_ANOME|nr:transcription factor HES-4-like [Anopheles merus]
MANPSKLNPHERHDDYASESYLRRIKAEIRKTNKPIMEKKRRARINNYLNDLKSLLLDAMKKDPVRHSKLEKADILDLTVKHLQDVERRRLNLAMAVDPTVPEKFANGYRECIDEIGKYFDSLGSVDEGLKARVRKHLESCLTFQPGKPFPAMGGLAGVPFGSFAGVPLHSPDDINNNSSNTTATTPSTHNGLLNRTFANNLSLMFPGGIPFPMGDPPASTMPFQPFPFFGALRGAPLPQPPFLGATQRDPPDGVHRQPVEKDLSDRPPSALTVPSPPASPPAAGDGTDDDGPGTTLRTPLGKTAGTQAEHNMERLLAIFPTPPSPEEQPSRSRLGKLGHHFASSPFVPTGRRSRSALLAEEDVSMEREEDVEREEQPEVKRAKKDEGSSQGRQRKDSDGDGKDNPNGEMWRPW